MNKPKILISIPAYNEEKTLPNVISEIKNAMDDSKYKKNYKILVLNDGSKDKTVEVAKKAGAIVVSHKRNQGLAQTFVDEVKEFLKSKADVMVHTDADGQYPAVFIPKLIEKIEIGYDLVLGSRFKGKIEKMPIMKRLGNIAFSFVFTTLIRKNITDTTTGFRAFTRDVAESITFINTFTYTQEQILKAARQKFKIKEIPIFARKTRDSRLFKSPLQYAIKAWINIFRIYRDYDPLKFFGVIGLSMFSLGFVIGLYFIYLHLTTGIVGHLGLLFLMLLLIFSGIQIVFFGFLADMVKK
tara:strand:+ start:410 stop:1303 length:894 start_codon:yes stop_codon:yes gene_type:complete